MNTLKGKNIFLRALESEDINYLFSIENNEKYWSISDSQIPFSRYLLNRYLKNSNMDIYEAKQLRLVITNFQNITIGLIDLFDIDFKNNRAGVAIIINEKMRSKGFAKEALELLIQYSKTHLSLHQLYCNILEDNSHSINLFKSVEFKQVGLKKDWIKFDGKYKNELLLQLICI
ncbi:GNAT family N-acetyltransferase [Flavobacteriaceae bacterium]|jgi:diamine N-acetyltransferase|nr:GNAT family N-acetyltransferase [Flavobacteriaceae bacterium]MDB4134920.1 GNAT family N-acetyltransferase [Flavobacteriaceae bacterium]MDB4196572.1 GNAT family N-acetyltransferase [Flavobacteriaceae bacterium]MDB4213006.1 GNAT family N-acetyltransferase [Flavobacteriaceae bacterium]|tara:strand:- start:1113 stop:1634 length:522 start_codon:yes stop_codon:yes gene_type:complete